LFDDNEEIVRTTYFKYISAIQTENEQLAEQTAAKFFTLTRCSAFEVCEKAQDMRAVLAQTLRPTS
jgi:hypothetical protein